MANAAQAPGADAAAVISVSGLPRQPAAPLSWLATAARLIAGLGPRYWAVLTLIYSGRAMQPFLPAEWRAGDVASALLLLFEFLARFWLPYLLIRAMAKHARPALPTLGFLWFVAIAFLFALVEGALISAAHGFVLAGESLDPRDMLRLIFVAELAAAALLVRLMPLYAGTATGSLNPLGPDWWRGLRGGALGLLGAAVIVAGAATLSARLLSVQPLRFDLPVILLLHLRQVVAAAEFLFFLGLSLAACTYAVRNSGFGSEGDGRVA